MHISLAMQYNHKHKCTLETPKKVTLSIKSSRTISLQEFELNHQLVLLIESRDARCQLQFAKSRPSSSRSHVTALPSCTVSNQIRGLDPFLAPPCLLRRS